MPRSKGKSKTSPSPNDALLRPPLNPLRTGMPAQDSIVGVKQMRKGGKVYRIIKTTEMDEYDAPAQSRSGKKRK